MMEDQKFWTLIDQSRAAIDPDECDGGDDFHDRQCDMLEKILFDLSPPEIIEFYERFYVFHSKAYDWNVWAVAYWLYGGCSDDSFTDFRACLISLGRERYDSIVSDPDSAVQLVDTNDVPFMKSEGFQYIAGKSYKNKTGRDIHNDLSNRVPHPKAPTGEDFNFDDDDEMRRRFPRLTKKLPESGMLD